MKRKISASITAVIIMLLLLGASFLYFFLSKEPVNYSKSSDFYEMYRHIQLLQVDTERLFYSLNLYRYDMSDNNRSHVQKELDLLRMRLNILSGNSAFLNYQTHFEEESLDLEEIFSWIDRVVDQDRETFLEYYSQIENLMNKAVSTEEGIVYRADILTRKSLEKSLNLLEKQYNEALFLILLTVLFLIGIIALGIVQWRTNIKLSLSENKFRLIYDEAYNFISILDRHGTLQDINKTALDVFGLELKDVKGHPFWETPWWNHSKELIHKLEVAVEKGKEGKISLFEVVHELEGENRTYIDVSVKPIYSKWGSVEQILVEGRDMTSRKEGEERILYFKKYLGSIIDSMPSSLIVVDNELNITIVNKKALKVLECDLESLYGQPVMTVFPYIDEIELIESLASDKSTLIKKHIRQKEGSTIVEDITIFPLNSEGNEGAVIRIDDVSEIHRMEEIMIQGEKMLSVGGLAAGMAHEINNPLAGMIQAAEVIYNRLSSLDIPANRKAAENAGLELEKLKNYMSNRNILTMLESMRESGARVAEIVENMLSFTSREGGAISTYRISELIDQILELASTDYNLKKHYDFKSIEIIREYEQGLPPIPCEGSRIKQVLLNIFKNGAEAMNALIIEQRMKGIIPQKAQFVIRLKYEEKEGMLRIEIEDNGPGMSEEVRRRVFEPFFPTKEVGEGPGLGLSVSYFIIQEKHHGSISVVSEEKGGSCFIIRLPVETTNIRQEVNL
jgi:PAS domain S-box-containing protein